LKSLDTPLKKNEMRIPIENEMHIIIRVNCMQ